MQKIKSFLLMASFVLSIVFSATGQVRVAPLDIKQRTLKNGLHVATLQDNSSPTVAIHVLFNVGGKNDPIGRSGFAHMFEHMMFKSTVNMPSEKMDRLTEDVGGFNNASTHPDFTNYYEVVPSNYLETLLWAESDRMVNLNVDDANFKSERDVVKEEFRQSVLAQPYGRFEEAVNNLAFQKHAYKRGVIGNLDELNAATPQDAQQFYKAYYRPDNAYLIVVGDFDQKQLDGWIDKYFGRIPRPAGAISRASEAEPEWTSERRFSESGPIVPFPAVAIDYLAPLPTDPDVPALLVAENVLSGGESSRLYQELVRKQQIAQEASFDADIRAERGLLTLMAIASENGTPEKMEAALLAEVRKMQEAPISAAELEKARNQLISRAIRGRETNDGKAIAIEQAIAYQGDPNAVNSEIQKIQSVTAADVQRAMKKYIKDNNRVVIYYTQGEKKDE